MDAFVNHFLYFKLTAVMENSKTKRFYLAEGATFEESTNPDPSSTA